MGKRSYGKDVLDENGIMLFGKYKDVDFLNVESGYLKWLLDNVDIVDEDYFAIKAELDSR